MPVSEHQPGTQRLMTAHHEPQPGDNGVDGRAGRQGDRTTDTHRAVLLLYGPPDPELAPGQFPDTGTIP